MNQLGHNVIPTCDVLLAVVTRVEIDAVFSKFSVDPNECTRYLGGTKTYFDLGTHGGARVFLVRSEMGTATAGGSMSTIKDAVHEVHPGVVIMVGIAFGIDAEKQDIGDVLVSKQLQSYEQQRVGTAGNNQPKVILRSDRVTASPKLLDKLRTCELTWSIAKVRFGLLLYGDKLVDNLDFRESLKSLAPEMIGGEMEGGGLHVVCQEGNVAWIIVKAICDWADGEKGENKSENQVLAAANAAAFVFETLRKGGFSIPRAPGQVPVAHSEEAYFHVGSQNLNSDTTAGRKARIMTVPAWALNLIASAVGVGLICLVLVNPKSYFVWLLVLAEAIFIALQYFHSSYKHWRTTRRMFSIGTLLALIPTIEIFVSIPDNGFVRFVVGASIILSVIFLACGLALSWIQYKSETPRSKMVSMPPGQTTMQASHADYTSVFSGLNANKIELTVGVSNENHGQLLSLTSGLVKQISGLQKRNEELSTSQPQSEELALRLIIDIRQARTAYDFKTANEKSELLEVTYADNGTAWGARTRRETMITIAEALQNKILAMDEAEDKSEHMSKLKSLMDKMDNA